VSLSIIAQSASSAVAFEEQGQDSSILSPFVGYSRHCDRLRDLLGLLCESVRRLDAAESDRPRSMHRKEPCMAEQKTGSAPAKCSQFHRKDHVRGEVALIGFDGAEQEAWRKGRACYSSFGNNTRWRAIERYEVSACGVSDVPVGAMENKECMAVRLNRTRALLYRWLENPCG